MKRIGALNEAEEMKLKNTITGGILCCFLMLVIPLQAQSVQVHTDSIATSAYFQSILKLALEKSQKGNKYTVNFKLTSLSQGRIIKELLREDGLVDIYNSGTTVKREESLIPIRIPLFKGTLGYRIPIIHKDNIPQFENIKTIDDLKQFTACQGEHWPDTDILEAANLRVLKNDNYKSMFTQTLKKYCDYFPRAIIEGYAELEAHDLEESDLRVYDKLLIMYPFPMYFFVSPHHEELAKDVQKGLEIAVEDGSFTHLFENSPVTSDIFPLSKWKDAVKIKIKNPILPSFTPVRNTKLWLSLDEKNHDK